MSTERMVISNRFCGPTNSGNGGYVCGRVAARLPGPATVRLMAPPPLETALHLDVSDDSVTLRHGSSLIAQARSADPDLTAPEPPSFAAAEQATPSYPGFEHHPFPRCFVCGPQRAAGDGLRIFPGAIPGRAIVAAPWVPDASLSADTGWVRPEFLWAALDCTSAFAVWSIPPGKAIVLGELCARIDHTIAPGERCVVVGWPLSVEGRKRFAASSVYSESGYPVAVGRATWIEVPAEAFSV